jgi:hypothetical protein
MLGVEDLAFSGVKSGWELDCSIIRQQIWLKVWVEEVRPHLVSE